MANKGTEYEKLVQDIFQAIVDYERCGLKHIAVRHNETIKGISGATHQIDVLWDFELGGFPYQTLMEIKNWKSPVKKEQIIAFHGILMDIPGQPHGAFVSSSGFQSGAMTYAKTHGIELITIRQEAGASAYLNAAFFSHYNTLDVSFTANSGEILGIAGISGCGQKELLEAIAGLQPVENGTVKYINDDGQAEELIGRDPLQIAAMGVALSFVPEDRLGMGLVGNMDLTDNMMLRSFRKGRSLFTDRKTPRKLAEKVVDELEVSTSSLSTPVRKLSGGNVQKVLVGREIASAPTVLLSAYIVRGLDINSSYTIYDLLNQQKKKGVAVIYVGEDLDVLMELSDRIMVLCGGKVSGIVDGRTADKNEIGMMMTKFGGGADNE